jgi:serine/threonine protein kinase
MDRFNDPLHALLSTWLSGTGLSLQSILDWYEQQAQPGESLVAFLCRQDIFRRDAAKSIQLMQKGYLDRSCFNSVLTNDWEAKLRGVLAADDLSFLLRRPHEEIPAVETHHDAIAENMTTQTLISDRVASTGSRSFAPDTRSTPPATPAEWLDHGSMRHMASPRPRISGSTQRARPTASTNRTQSPLRSGPNRHGGPPTRGTVLGKYLLTETIGKGTSGIVFRALNQVLNLSVAVKVLSLPEDGSAGNALDALAAEARLLASLNHPNIVRLWDFEADPHMPYLVMEYVDGASLAELIRQSGRLSVERALELMCQVIEGLDSAWSLGIVHRDVKPHNILVSREGRPKIADLGLAVVVDGTQTEGNKGELAGTAAYMSPEQGLLADQPVDFRSDIYSLGATLYHALTGRTPYTGQSTRELMHLHAHGTPLPPHELVPGLSPEVSEVVLTMMARHPDDRYQSAAELLTVLRGLLYPPMPLEADQGTVRTRPATPPSASTPSIRPSGFWRRLFTGGNES